MKLREGVRRVLENRFETIEDDLDWTRGKPLDDVALICGDLSGKLDRLAESTLHAGTDSDVRTVFENSELPLTKESKRLLEYGGRKFRIEAEKNGEVLQIDYEFRDDGTVVLKKIDKGDGWTCEAFKELVRLLQDELGITVAIEKDFEDDGTVQERGEEGSKESKAVSAIRKMQAQEIK